MAAHEGPKKRIVVQFRPPRLIVQFQAWKGLRRRDGHSNKSPMPKCGAEEALRLDRMLPKVRIVSICYIPPSFLPKKYGMRATAAAGIIAAMIVIAALGVGIGYGIGTTVPSQGSITVSSSSSTQSSSATSSSESNASTFDLTLVVTTGNIYNSTVGDQPAFYVLGPSGLESSASIALPAHRLIRLTIIDYDDGAANLTGSQYSTVSGTKNNMVTEISDENVNSSQGPAGIQISGGENVTSLAPDNVAHTFTIPQLGINIPIAPSSTVVAYFTINQTGTYSWFCQTACGSGADGLEGAMETPGWMTGNTVVS